MRSNVSVLAMLEGDKKGEALAVSQNTRQQEKCEMEPKKRGHRLDPRHDTFTRSKIQTSQILNPTDCTRERKDQDGSNPG